MKRRKSWWKEAPVAEEEAREEGIWSDGQNRYHADPGGRDGPSTHFFRAFGGGGIALLRWYGILKNIYFFKGPHYIHQQCSLEYRSMHPCFHCTVGWIPYPATRHPSSRGEGKGLGLSSSRLFWQAAPPPLSLEREGTPVARA